MTYTPKILVTGIGGMVGQGILRNLRSMKEKFFLIGTNVEKISSGNHLCNKVYEVPYAFDRNYIPTIKNICAQSHVDLIIPSTDSETVYLLKNKESLPLLAGGNIFSAEIFFNKLKTWQEFQNKGIPFAKTVLPSEYDGSFDEIIVKPAEGRGSRGININPKNYKQFSDEYIVQELHKGVEITTAFYITRDRKIHGHITLERELVSGFTQKCSVVKRYDLEIEKIISEINKKFKLKGSYNIQSIATSDGRVIPFEINGRVSGTNSIRSQFGFKDIEYLVNEYIYNKKLSAPKITTGSAIRIVMDIIYPETDINRAENNESDHYLF